LLALQGAALWPVWQWYVRRTTDGSDEPWGLLALGAALLLAWGQRGNLRLAPATGLLIGAGVLSLLSAVSTLWLPPLARAMLGVSALALTLIAVLERSRPMLPLWTLLLLSLPIVSSLQFYLGYPLRAFTAWSSSGLLQLAGLQVQQEGTTLLWGGHTVMVDAPCSGIHMLWVGAFMTALLSWFARAGAWRCILNGAGGAVVVVAANVLRNTVLFIKEAQIVRLPDCTHVGVGLGAFLLTAVLIATLVQWRPHAN